MDTGSTPLARLPDDITEARRIGRTRLWGEQEDDQADGASLEVGHGSEERCGPAGTGSEEQEARNRKQGTGSKEQEARNAAAQREQEARNRKRGTGSEEQGARNAAAQWEQEARNRKRGTGSEEQEARNRKRGTGSEEQEARNAAAQREQEARNRERGTGSEEQGARNAAAQWEQEARNRKQGTGSKEQEARNRKIPQMQIPVNCPFRTRVTNYQRDGPMCMFDNQGGAPNYYPNSFSAPEQQPQFVESKFKVSPDVARYNSADDDNFTQVRTFYTQVLNEEERQRLCQNMAGALKGAQLFIQKRMLENLKAVHPDYGNQVQTLLNKYNAEAKKNTAVHVYSRPGVSAMAASSKM
ncbi:uncharacterized protein LOC129107997 [Anoplopoma fimbria]|uniref:uncharacterized protein LOC129107997 n=1 Tax=Anoplopoma fimbria TaxID=229290 RepID=UPI0023EAB0C1|nr:uncharacterized protein LOC129107997 [Anoplopoma fimbria]